MLEGFTLEAAARCWNALEPQERPALAALIAELPAATALRERDRALRRALALVPWAAPTQSAAYKLRYSLEALKERPVSEEVDASSATGALRLVLLFNGSVPSERTIRRALLAGVPPSANTGESAER